jgi:hypothetical protein
MEAALLEEALMEVVPDRGLLEAVGRGDMELLRSSLDLGADPNAATDFGECALHRAVRRGHLEAFHALLEAGADLELREPISDMTPLLVAIAETNIIGLDGAPDAAERRVLPMIVALIKLGADVDAGLTPTLTNRFEEKPLHGAVKFGRRRIILTLLRAGALIGTTDRFELSFMGDEKEWFLCWRKKRGDARLRVNSCNLEHKDLSGPDFNGDLDIESIDGKPITAEFSSADLFEFQAHRHCQRQPYRVGFFHRVRYYPTLEELELRNKSACPLMDAIEKAGSFDEYARRLQRDVHVAILTKCLQEKLPLDVKTVLTTYLWKWGGA